MLRAIVQGTAKQGDRMLLLANDSSVSNRGEAYRY
jgi:hypothetical protein